MPTFRVLLFLIGCLLPAAEAGQTRFYFLDVEGGTATLIVTASGKSLLIDAGWPDTSAPRIAHVARDEAGLTKIDYLVATHFHRGHIGGVEDLARLIPIGQFIDHGESVESDEATKGALSSYLRTVKGKRRVVAPGDRIPLDGLSVEVVSSAGKLISKPLTADSSNPFCANAVLKEDDPTENGQSVGLVITAGKFRFAALGDMTWNNEHRMACPVNLLGKVDVLQLSQHGNKSSGAPQQLYALRPEVAILNNGPKTPGVGIVQKALFAGPHPPELWELHSVDAEARNPPETFIANPDPDRHEGDIIMRVEPNGQYSVINTRNGFTRNHTARASSAAAHE